ncbi:Sec1-like protein [Suhomyces tanzawaensis NRRL Y-17324]|uniref:Sec1-like protein n=1 Tax=Suhomyces tanzawaensis NRRL Y-17324 TaxID=984487 RepID=A0A1E4SAX4_9ASCO|nr:Sec1-like protein [Suhomyces tanzawaensis NRRL Y-17324]ODV76626.1 Sec1-like protein [Suhomyces tanzawaensis NRRL Y-17324]
MSFNTQTLESLTATLARVLTSNNLLVLDRLLSPLINHLTSFLNLKQSGKFNNLIWLDEPQQTEVFDSFNGLIVLLQESPSNLALLAQLYNTVPKSLKIHLIVSDLSKSFLYQLNDTLAGNLNFRSLLHFQQSQISLTTRIKAYSWKTFPIEDEFVLFSDLQLDAHIDHYLDEPLKQVNELASALIQVMFPSDTSFKHKLRNIYGKGDHAKLFIDLLNDHKIPEYLNASLNPLELEFYRTKFASNTDLVVLERNLDYTSVLFNQLNYHGLINDLFGMEFTQIVNIPEDVEDEKISKNLKDDVLYNNTLKHLNFSSSGLKLSKLAKYVQQQFKLKDNKSDDLDDIKKIVSSLGSLTLKQDLIKKHTMISEAIISKINAEYEEYLVFQNDLFENDYKSHLASIKHFIDSNFDQQLIFSSLILVSIVNNGIKERDFEWILQDCMDLFGLETALALEKLITYKLIRLLHESSGDFFSNLGITSAPEEVEKPNTVGITAGQDVYSSNYALIDKYWNLHPIDEDIAPANGDDEEDVSLIDSYQNPSFTLPSNTVPILYRLVEALYFRDFLKYKPTNNLKKRPNWENLQTDMFGGATVDINVDDRSDIRGKRVNGTEAQPRGSEYLVIVLLGGITRAEITCFKYLQQKLDRHNKRKKLVVLTSGIVNNRSMLEFFTG